MYFTMRIVYIQSITLFLTIFQGSLMAKCHWPKSMTHGHKPNNHDQTVIDQSMTIFEWAVQELSLTSQWHFFCDSPPLIQNCHWPVDDSFRESKPWWKRNLYKSVIDRSMTVWLWTSGLWPYVIDFGQWHLAISEPWNSVIDWMYTIQRKATHCKHGILTESVCLSDFQVDKDLHIWTTHPMAATMLRLQWHVNILEISYSMRLAVWDFADSAQTENCSTFHFLYVS